MAVGVARLFPPRINIAERHVATDGLVAEVTRFEAAVEVTDATMADIGRGTEPPGAEMVDMHRAILRSDELVFTQVYSTPGGLVRAAPVSLKEVRIGALRLRHVRASVSERPMDISLLGASFLNRLDGYEVSGGKMTLRW